ncbi:HNH endonuclease [Clostridium argentinense]|nr:HNH endonuclease [Clostridium argentinense]
MKINNGRLFCEACGFDFFEVYGERGKDFIEGHHTKFVSELSDGDMTRVEDIAMLCSNCHRMIHRKSVLTVSELAEKVEDIKRKKRL